ncbi:AEC family transporter [Sediminivirga luteola]|uniref:Membrane protein n=1 Tax=Sediminivirga luteola TaxID=1774748 RepID=A0A8J2TZ04_9MICO|nr:AEC family transporter [Sediminivirga luteola]GGA18809.1 membrane protein [Sediminivirga luteola]
MLGVLEGFGVIGVVIFVGFLLGRLDILGDTGQQALARLIFYAATPALLFTTIAESPIDRTFSSALLATGGTALFLGVVFALLSRFVFKRSTGVAVIGGWAVSYVNIGNLGLPIAAYVLQDVGYVAPVLMFQLVVLAPIGIAVLDAQGAKAGTAWWRKLLKILGNPLLIGSAAGVACSATGYRPPTVLYEPISLIAGISVPAALIVFGFSLRNGWKIPPRDAHAELGLVMLFKLILHPFLAWLVGGPLLGYSGLDLFAIVLTSALPTAQNVYIYALRYQRGTALARDAVFLTTFTSIAVIIGVAMLLG